MAHDPGYPVVVSAGSVSGGGGGGGSGGGSNIRVFVRWQDQTVFAGEDIRCRITFRNVAPKPATASGTGPTAAHRRSQPSNSYQPDRARLPSASNSPSASPLASASASGSGSGLLPPPFPRGRHRPSLSLSGPAHPLSGPVSASGSAHGHAPASASLSGSSAAAPSHRRADSASHSQGHSHRRSLSIVSISSAGAASEGSPTAAPLPPSQRPMRGHFRASSLQISSRGPLSGPRSATNPSRPFSTNQPSPLFNASFPDRSSISGLPGLRGSRSSGSVTAPNTPGPGTVPRMSPRVPPRSASTDFAEFKFPAAPLPPNSPSLANGSAGKPLKSAGIPEDPLPPQPTAPAVPTIFEAPSVTEARILSTTSISGTPRSSGEFYSLSNHSSETLASEYVGQQQQQQQQLQLQQQQQSLPLGRQALHARHKSSNLLPPPPSFHSPQQQRQHGSKLGQSRASRSAALVETLMMGFAQVQGSFTLDGSLVDLEPFELVKRKAVVGGQGGGVIGIEPGRRGGGRNENGSGFGSGNGNGTGGAKRDSLLSRGLGGWGSLATSITSSIGSSLGELLGGGELSTIKEMRDMASAKAVPLLSTPQSVLFVDLKLGPGESRTFDYTFRLPKGLPPTHRGKLIKIAYCLVLGTQRAAGSAKEQRVKSLEIPFRVLGSVNAHGEILGHDLMSPYVLLRDQAQVQAVPEKDLEKPLGYVRAKGGREEEDDEEEGSRSGRRHRRRSSAAAAHALQDPRSTLDGFLDYVDQLLKDRGGAEGWGGAAANGRGVSSAGPGLARRDGLLSPTATMPVSRRASAQSLFDEYTAGGAGGGQLSAREAIDFAILRSNAAMAMDGAGSSGTGGGGHTVSANRFEIARNGRRVGTVLLARPAYRLGESVTLAVDFFGADVPCYAVHAALETAERVLDPALALRSEASIQRVTRRVYASASEATLYARRFVFTPSIPATASPEFVTTGVSLEWKIRLEFVVPMERGDVSNDNNCNDNDEDDDRPRKPAFPPLLEQVSHDDSGGLVLVAAETLQCESFEAAVPLRVYGWSSGGGGGDADFYGDSGPVGLPV